MSEGGIGTMLDARGQRAPGSDEQAGVPLGERDDGELLTRIALRDREAFACFFERHHRHAFNLALRITHSSSSAEEAAQEALLRVWKYAGGFRPPGSPQTWFMRIVAREAVRHLRHENKVLETHRQCPRPDPEVGFFRDQAVGERGDQSAELRRLLDRLPALDQRILALYFGAELTQMQIGLELRISPRAVSRRLTQLLAALKRQVLAGASRTLRASQLPGLLAQALLAGPGLSKAAQEALLGRLPEAVAGNSRPSLRNGSTRTPSFAQRLPLLSAGLLSLGAFLLGSMEQTSPSTASGSPSLQPARSPPEATAAEGRVRRESAAALQARVWSFAKGDLREELPRLGPAQWGLTNLGLKALWVPQGGEPEWLLPPDPIPPAPFALCVVWRASQEGHSTIQPVWRDGLRMLPFLKQNRKGKRIRYIRELKRHRYLFVDHRVLTFPDAGMRMPWSVLTYERPYPAAQVGLVLQNCVLCEVALRPLGPGELDEAQAGLAQLLKRTDLEVQRHEAAEIGAGSLPSGVRLGGAGP